MGGELEVELRLGLGKEGKLVAGCGQVHDHFSHLMLWNIIEIYANYFSLKITVKVAEQRRQWYSGSERPIST